MGYYGIFIGDLAQDVARGIRGLFKDNRTYGDSAGEWF